MAKREHPRYENTEWPDYEFREYPKMVYPGATDPTKPYGPNGKPLKGIQVHNAEEERVALGLEDDGEEADTRKPATATKEGALRGGKTVATGARGVERLRTDDDEKAEVVAEAETLGIKFDKAWSAARIQDAIDTYRAEVV
jgi:hypothetical protein